MRSWAFDASITRYALVDMDGDGVREAVVDFQYGETVRSCVSS